MRLVYKGSWGDRRPACSRDTGSVIVAPNALLGCSTRWTSDGQFWVPEVPGVLLSSGNVGSVVAGPFKRAHVGKVLMEVRIPGSSMRHNGHADLEWACSMKHRLSIRQTAAGIRNISSSAGHCSPGGWFFRPRPASLPAATAAAN
jgi:hypothetical protein